jgi:hypothetical protein
MKEMSAAFFRRGCLILMGCVSFALIYAQEYLYEIGGMGGVASYMGDVNRTNPFKGLNPALGVVFRYNANFRVAFKGDMAWAKVSGRTEGQDNVFPERAQASFDRNLFELGGQFEFNFFPYSDKYAYLNTKRFSPYLLIGLGATVAPGSGSTFAGVNLPAGVGVKYKLKNRLNLGCEISIHRLFGDGLDVTDDSNRILNNPYGTGGSMLKNKDWYSVLTFSVTWDFGPRNCQCNSPDGVLF